MPEMLRSTSSPRFRTRSVFSHNPFSRGPSKDDYTAAGGLPQLNKEVHEKGRSEMIHPAIDFRADACRLPRHRLHNPELCEARGARISPVKKSRAACARVSSDGHYML
jgi:hypothetical protein